jgi:GAF domain-containing protein
MNQDTGLQRKVHALYEITLAINSTLNEDKILSAMLERIVSELGYRAATLRLLDEEQNQLELKASHGLSETYLKKGRVDVSKSGVDRMVLGGRWVTIADAAHDPGFQYPEAAAKEGLASLLAVALTYRNRSIGVLHVYTAEPHEFRESEKAFMAAIANLGAQAIIRTRMFDSFHRFAQHINSAQDLKDVLATLLLQSVKELNVKAGSVRLLGSKRQTLHLAAAYGLSDTYLKKGLVTVAQSPIDRRVLEEAKPMAIADISEEPTLQYRDEALNEGVRSIMVVPLDVRGTVIGVMRFYSTQLKRFSDEAIDFAMAVADLGAVAIENAKLHELLKQRVESMKEDVDGWYRYLALG